MKQNIQKKGVTLVEIITTLIVVGILLAIAVPSIIGYVKKAENVKFETTAHTANLKAYEYINKSLILNTSSIESLKKDLTLSVLMNGKLDNKIDTIIEVEPVNGYSVCSVDVNFDNLTDERGWVYDLTLKEHQITKSSVRFCKTDTDGKFTISSINDSKFVVTLNNDRMYYFDNMAEANDASIENRPEVPLAMY